MRTFTSVIVALAFVCLAIPVFACDGPGCSEQESSWWTPQPTTALSSYNNAYVGTQVYIESVGVGGMLDANATGAALLIDVSCGCPVGNLDARSINEGAVRTTLDFTHSDLQPGGAMSAQAIGSLVTLKKGRAN